MSDDYSVNVRCRRGRLRFPPVCANCGAPGTQSIPIERAFLKGGENQSWTYVRFDPLFCSACAGKHWLESPPMPFGKRVELMLRTWHTLGVVGALCFMTFFGLLAFKELLRGGKADFLIPGLVASLFGLIAVWSAMNAFSATRRLAMPRTSSVTGAVDFSDDLSEMFEPAWRKFTFRNAAYREAFAAQNQGLLWDRHGADARRAQGLRFDLKIVGLIALGLAAIYFAYDEYIRPIVSQFAK